MKEKSTAVEFAKNSSRQREPAAGESRSDSRQENTFWSRRLKVYWYK